MFVKKLGYMLINGHIMDYCGYYIYIFVLNYDD